MWIQIEFRNMEYWFFCFKTVFISQKKLKIEVFSHFSCVNVVIVLRKKSLLILFSVWCQRLFLYDNQQRLCDIPPTTQVWVQWLGDTRHFNTRHHRYWTIWIEWWGNLSSWVLFTIQFNTFTYQISGALHKALWKIEYILILIIMIINNITCMSLQKHFTEMKRNLYKFWLMKKI